jgi:hypothetical protein
MQIFEGNEIMEILIFVEGRWIKASSEFLQMIFDHYTSLIMSNTFWEADIKFDILDKNSNNRGLNNINTPNGSVTNYNNTGSSTSLNSLVGTSNKGLVKKANNSNNSNIQSTISNVGTLNRGFINISLAKTRRAKTRRAKTRRAASFKKN